MAREGHPAQVSCRVLAVSESGFYAWRSRSPSVRAIRHAWLTDMITQVHVESNGTYGAPRVRAELVMGRGITVGHNAVAMLMRRAGLQGLPGARRRRPKHQTPTAGDLVERSFARPEPNQLWVTDITEHPTREGKVYCAVVLDTFSRRIVGWSIDTSAHKGETVPASGSRSRCVPHGRAAETMSPFRSKRSIARSSDVRASSSRPRSCIVAARSG